MKTTIHQDGSIKLDIKMLEEIGVKVGDQVDLYVRDGISITIVKAGTKRDDWNEWFETATVSDFPEREQP